MGRLKEYPPGFRAPGSDLVVRRTVGLRQFGKHDRGQAVEVVCLRPREDKGGEPCGNVRTILAKRVAGLRAIKACEECAQRSKNKGRQAANLPDAPKEGLKAELAAVNIRNYEQIRARLEAEGGSRWAEFVDYRDRRLALAHSSDPDLQRYALAAWTVQMEIEAIQVVLCSPPSLPRKEPQQMSIPGLLPFKVKLADGSEQILNLANVQRFSVVPEPDDADHPRLADDPPPGIRIILLFSVEFSVTLGREDSERLLGVLVAQEAAILSAVPLFRGQLSPPSTSNEEGGANV